MTTKTKKKPDPVGFDHIENVITMIAGERLDPHPDNPRKTPTGADLATLAASIRVHDILQPITVRRIGKRMAQRYQIIAGERRWRAHQKVRKGQSLPCIVRDADDATAMEMMVIENLERVDLTPFEESAGFNALLAQGWTYDAISEHVGRSVGTIARRVRLVALGPMWRKAVKNPERPESRWPAGCLDLIARFPTPAQERLMDALPERLRRTATERSLDRWLREHFMCSLGDAPWKMEDADILPAAGACSKCPKRSSHSPTLFDSIQGEKVSGIDQCLDFNCFHTKMGIVRAGKITAAREKHGDHQLYNPDGYDIVHYPEVDKVLKGRKVLLPWDCSVVKKGGTPAIVVHGPEVGKVIRVKVKKQPASAATKKREGPTPIKERRDALTLRRGLLFTRAVMEMLGVAEEASPDPKLEAVLKAYGKVPDFRAFLAKKSIDYTLALALAYQGLGLNDEAETPKGFIERYTTLWSMDVKELRQLLVEAVLEEAETHLGRGVTQKHPDIVLEAAALATALQIDKDSLAIAVNIELPEPKTWANLNADGTPKMKKGAVK